ncbi:MAG: hypothetical protein R3F04_07725 [Lysobacteraceae bacterium]
MPRFALFLTVLLGGIGWAQAAPLLIADQFQVDFGTDQPRVIRDTLPGENGGSERVTYVVEKSPVMRFVGTIKPYGASRRRIARRMSIRSWRSIQAGMPNLQIVDNQAWSLGDAPGRRIEAGNRQVSVLARVVVTNKELLFAQSIFPRGNAAARTAAIAFLDTLTTLPKP